MYTETDLNKLIADVTKEFTSHLAKAEEDMPKSKEKDEKSDSKEEGSEPKEEKEAPTKGAEDQHQQGMSKDPAKEEGKPESKEERVEEDKKENAKPSDDPHGQALDHGYDDEDMQHMHSMYSSMSPAELKAHHDAVRKCMDMSKAEAPMAPAPEAEMAKSEKDIVVSEVSLLKSELEAVKAKSAEEKKNLETAMAAFLTKFVEKTAPAGKAITSLDVIAKSVESMEKPLQKSEIDAKLIAKAKETTLSKSDRDAINSYYCGSKNIETVRHLLK